ncbi:hypothetical protein KHQ88_06610 [Mycoplasmatota bacterium]|nr:hypothetical protein KHQ88_06610 [Mycoplasmatota bacterium]
MVEYQIKRRSITDPLLLEVFLNGPRHLFVNQKNCAYAYEDHPMGIGYNQTIYQPYVVAYMIDKSLISPTDKVLEIGTGSGYHTAILTELAKQFIH